MGKKRSFGRGKRLERGWDWWGGESVVLGCVGLGFGVEGGCCAAMGVWGVRNFGNCLFLRKVEEMGGF